MYICQRHDLFLPAYGKQGKTGDSFLSETKHIRLDSIPLPFHFIYRTAHLDNCVIMAV